MGANNLYDLKQVTGERVTLFPPGKDKTDTRSGAWAPCPGF